MNILLIGGTHFLGRHCVNTALRRGHTVTLFHRGKTNPDIFPDIEHLIGDRRSNTEVLAHRKWDGIIDTCGYIPSDIENIAERLAGNIHTYMFVSSVSVYKDNAVADIDEHYPVATMPDGADTTSFAIEYYGALKALCEEKAVEKFGDNVINVRPGLIVGEFDPSDRFTYWVRRGAQGGTILIPGGTHYPIQYIDVRDLADWMILALENRLSGTYNAVTPPNFTTLSRIVEIAAQKVGVSYDFVYAPDDFFEKHQIAPWSQMPVWLPESMEDYAGFSLMSVEKAVRDGMTFRTPEDTVRDILEWDNKRDKSNPMRAGILSEKEEELLSLFHKEE